MSISDDEVYVCDFCGDDTGRFNSETGNHVSCEKVAELQSTITAQEDIIKRMSSLAKDAIELLDCDTENSAVEKAIEDTKYEFTSLMKELVEKGIEVVG
jgi:hypothetical protein